MPIDYARLARQHGGTVVEDEDATQRAQTVDYAKLAAQHGGSVVEDEDAGTLDEELRTPPIGIDPRLDPDAVMNPAQTKDMAGNIARGYMGYGTMAAVGPAANVATKVLANPLTSAAWSGGATLYSTGDPIKAAVAAGGAYGTHVAAGKVIQFAKFSKALAARLEHQVARAAIAEAPTAATAKAIAPAAKAAAVDMEALLIKATDPNGSSATRNAARSALDRAGWTPDKGMMATPIVEEAAPAVARKLAPIPTKGNVKMATVYTKPSTQGPQPLSDTQAALRAKQLQAAREAGVDLGDAFGGAVRPGAEQAAESVLETRLRASVMLHKDKAGLANEIGQKVMALKEAGGKAATTERISAAIEEQYGLPSANVRQMVEMVLREASR